MNLYEHTIIARPDTSSSQIKQIQEKYSKIVEKFEGNIVKTENWGLLNMSYLIKKNKKGNYIHFKIEGNGKIIFKEFQCFFIMTHVKVYLPYSTHIPPNKVFVSTFFT